MSTNENLIDFKIITPKGIVLDERVSFVKVKTEDGDMGFLKGHESFAAILLEGELDYTVNGDKLTFATVGGSVFIENDSIIILTQFAAVPELLDKILEERLEMLSKIYDEDVKSGAELQKAEMALRRFLSKGGGTGGY